MKLYVIIYWLGILPQLIVLGFTILGPYQWTKRGSLFKDHTNILLLEIFYIIILISYLRIYSLKYLL